MHRALVPARLPDKIPPAVDNCQHPCFGLTESLQICYCNPAWDRFAQENDGGKDVLAAQVIGEFFLRFVPTELESHFRGLFEKARALGSVQSQDYECSTPELFRLFRMEIYPLHPGHGFVVINSLRVEHPHTRKVCSPDAMRYTDNNGLIHMCSNCRRTNRVDKPMIWDWVPAYVRSGRRDLTHGICPFCREYYYGPYLARTQR